MGVRVIVLTPGDYGTNQGLRYNPERRTWVRERAVVPDIVLRRSSSFSKATAALATRELNQLKAIGKLHTLPRIASNKWTFYKLLARVPQLRGHLPRTSLCSSGRELFNTLQSRSDVYIKPLGGSRGVSIYRLRRDGAALLASWERRIVPRKHDQTSNVFQPDTRIEERAIPTLADCLAFWKETKLRRAIVQDTVCLPKRDGSPYDFRWLMGGSDKPQVVARIARLGRPQSITTNIHTGGRAVEAEEMIEDIVGKSQRDQTVRRLDQVAMRVVQTLAKAYGPFAEVGIDLALTENGDIYIFEMNPTPGRRMLRNVDSSLHRLSLEAILEYVIRATAPSRGRSGKER